MIFVSTKQKHETLRPEFISHLDRDTVYKLANIAIGEVFLYCSANEIVINYDKCCFIEFKPPADKPHQMLAFPNHEIILEFLQFLKFPKIFLTMRPLRTSLFKVRGIYYQICLVVVLTIIQNA